MAAIQYLLLTSQRVPLISFQVAKHPIFLKHPLSNTFTTNRQYSVWTVIYGQESDLFSCLRGHRSIIANAIKWQ